MFNLKRASKNSGLLNFDWQSVLEQLQKCDPKDGTFYIITLNKGTPDEYRTPFMSFQEAKELVILALEKKKLRIPLSL